MRWFVWKWWRFGFQQGEGVKSPSLKIKDGDGTWLPVLKTRLVFLVEKHKR
ncbi:hypothetical protein [Escherichia coli]|uniref:hypothetical protein n=1 Tax=Escherichia coli TaxID=562 RepID=UPI0031F30634